MKIGITCYPTHGGSGVVATELGLELARRGHEIHFISYSMPFRLREFYQNVFYHEVDVSNYPLFKYPPYDLALATRMVSVIKEHSLDILHVHYAIPHAASAYMARQVLGKDSVKIVTTLHGTDITLVGRDPSFYEVLKFSIENSDGVTAVSNYLRDRTRDEFNLKKQITVIYNFIDTNRYSGKSEDCCRYRYAPNNEAIFLHVSNFRPVKRIHDVIAIFARVVEKVPAKLILVGEGPDREPAYTLAQKLNILKHIHFLGNQDFLEKLLGCVDIFLLPSREESFGLAALEAMSSYCTVIASDTGGLPELVIDGDCGYLLPVGDVEGMASKALTLLANPVLLDQFKQNARNRAVEMFNASQIISQYELFYEKLLQ